MLCGRCGKENLQVALFCSRCGAPLAMTAQAVSAPAASPRNTRTFRVTVIALAALALLATDLLLTGVGAGAIALALALVLALLPLPYYLSLALWADRFEPEPYRLLVATFLWGAGVGGFLAGVLNGAGTDVVSDTVGEGAGAFYGPSISAPIVEEGLKGAVLFLLWWRTRAINGVLDGIVYALMAGLGFAFAENTSYYAREAAEGGFPAAFTEFIGRGLLIGLLHPAMTALTGVGIGLAVMSSRRAVKVGAPIAGLVAAMLMHSLHNSMAGGYVEYQYWLLVPLTSLTLAAVVLLSLRRERKIVRAHVPPDVLPPDDVRDLYSIRGRISGAIGALVRGGWRGFKARDEYIRTISELAWQRYRAAQAPASAEKPPSDVEATYRARLAEVGDRLGQREATRSV
jgi:protease PrsW